MRETRLPGWALGCLFLLVVGALLFAGRTEKSYPAALDTPAACE